MYNPVNLKHVSVCNFAHLLRPVHTKDKYYNNDKDNRSKKIAVYTHNNDTEKRYDWNHCSITADE